MIQKKRVKRPTAADIHFPPLFLHSSLIRSPDLVQNFLHLSKITSLL